MIRATQLFVSSLLAGCQAAMYGTAADFNRLSIGMTRPEVVRAIGQPNTVTADAQKNEEHLIYRRMAQVVGWTPRNYDVTLVDGRVVRFGVIQE